MKTFADYGDEIGHTIISVFSCSAKKCSAFSPLFLWESTTSDRYLRMHTIQFRLLGCDTKGRIIARTNFQESNNRLGADIFLLFFFIIFLEF